MQEEQEREVAQEKEEERQIERPPAAVPRAHSLHADVKSLVLTGVTPHRSLPLCLRFLPLSNHVEALRQNVWSGCFPHIWVTNDFMRTIEETWGTTLPPWTISYVLQNGFSPVASSRTSFSLALLRQMRSWMISASRSLSRCIHTEPEPPE
jgi:hypothetical protein